MWNDNEIVINDNDEENDSNINVNNMILIW